MKTAAYFLFWYLYLQPKSLLYPFTCHENHQCILISLINSFLNNLYTLPAILQRFGGHVGLKDLNLKACLSFTLCFQQSITITSKYFIFQAVQSAKSQFIESSIHCLWKIYESKFEIKFFFWSCVSYKLLQDVHSSPHLLTA